MIHGPPEVMAEHRLDRMGLVVQLDKGFNRRGNTATKLRRDKRRTAFQVRLAWVLAGGTYQHLDAVTKERLLADVTGIVLPATGRGL